MLGVSMSEQTVQQSHTACREEGSLLVDVRSPGEFSAVHAEGAVNIPLDNCTSDAVQELVTERQAEKVYLICQSGTRAHGCR